MVVELNDFDKSVMMVLYFWGRSTRNNQLIDTEICWLMGINPDDREYKNKISSSLEKLKFTGDVQTTKKRKGRETDPDSFVEINCAVIREIGPVFKDGEVVSLEKLAMDLLLKYEIKTHHQGMKKLNRIRKRAESRLEGVLDDLCKNGNLYKSTTENGTRYSRKPFPDSFDPSDTPQEPKIKECGWEDYKDELGVHSDDLAVKEKKSSDKETTSSDSSSNASERRKITDLVYASFDAAERHRFDKFKEIRDNLNKLFVNLKFQIDHVKPFAIYKEKSVHPDNFQLLPKKVNQIKHCRNIKMRLSLKGQVDAIKEVASLNISHPMDEKVFNKLIDIYTKELRAIYN